MTMEASNPLPTPGVRPPVVGDPTPPRESLPRNVTQHHADLLKMHVAELVWDGGWLGLTLTLLDVELPS